MYRIDVRMIYSLIWWLQLLTDFYMERRSEDYQKYKIIV